MPAGYAATTQVESTWGDEFTAELSNLRVAESLPAQVGGAGLALHVMPPGARLVFNVPRASRRPSNIIPIGGAARNPAVEDIFYLGLDIEFGGTQLGQPGKPARVDVEVRFFLEAYGTSSGADATSVQRREINIQPQTFLALNADPAFAGADREIRHQLWVQVARQDMPNGIIEDPDLNTVAAWDNLFQPETVYRVAATVKIVNVGEYVADTTASPLTGFIEGLVMQTTRA